MRRPIQGHTEVVTDALLSPFTRSYGDRGSARVRPTAIPGNAIASKTAFRLEATAIGANSSSVNGLGTVHVSESGPNYCVLPS